MKRFALEALIFALLVAAGVAVRCAFHEDYPNFSPVAAIALFAGYYFRSAIVAVLCPLAIMEISNRLIPDGGYGYWLVLLGVYGSLAAPVFARSLVRRLDLSGQSVGRSLASLIGLIGTAAGSSVLFFVVTNLAHWAATDMYPHSSAGLISCYVQAIPFFRFTLVGDLCFGVVLFTGYLAAAQLAGRWVSEVESSNSQTKNSVRVTPQLAS